MVCRTALDGCDNQIPGFLISFFFCLVFKFLDQFSCVMFYVFFNRF